MKKALYITLITFLLTTSCKKEYKSCKTNTESTDDNQSFYIKALSSAPEILDTLSKYPQLQVFRIIDDQYMIGMHCNIFYHGLQIFTDDYRLFKSKNDNSISGLDTIPMNLDISLTPTIQYDQAIKIARKTMNYGHTCVSYQLGISNKNAGMSFQSKDYRLTWKIQGKNGLPIVVLDANNGQIYTKDDGSDD